MPWDEQEAAFQGSDREFLLWLYQEFSRLMFYTAQKYLADPHSQEEVVQESLKKLIEKVADGLSIMDKKAEIQRDKKGNILFDKETKDTEIVKYEESIEDYMAREVLPHIPDAVAFFEEDLGKKKPVVKTGAEIPFTRYFS